MTTNFNDVQVDIKEQISRESEIGFPDQTIIGPDASTGLLIWKWNQKFFFLYEKFDIFYFRYCRI